nr:hypothetical protein [Pyrinomonadaceae bacterium]
MNIFEDLVEELKEENLLEETVIEINLEREKAANKTISEKFAVANEQPTAIAEEDLNAVLSEFKDILDDDSKPLPAEKLGENTDVPAENLPVETDSQFPLKSEAEFPP